MIIKYTDYADKLCRDYTKSFITMRMRENERLRLRLNLLAKWVEVDQQRIGRRAV